MEVFRPRGGFPVAAQFKGNGEKVCTTDFVAIPLRTKYFVQSMLKKALHKNLIVVLFHHEAFHPIRAAGRRH